MSESELESNFCKLQPVFQSKDKRALLSKKHFLKLKYLESEWKHWDSAWVSAQNSNPNCVLDLLKVSEPESESFSRCVKSGNQNHNQFVAVNAQSHNRNWTQKKLQNKSYLPKTVLKQLSLKAKGYVSWNRGRSVQAIIHKRGRGKDLSHYIHSTLETQKPPLDHFSLLCAYYNYYYKHSTVYILFNLSIRLCCL